MMYEDLIKRLRYENLTVLQMIDLMDEAADAIENLDEICQLQAEDLQNTSVVERKTGKWIDGGLDYIGTFGIEYRFQKCSECENSFSKAPRTPYPKYCSECGAKMIQEPLKYEKGKND